MCINPRLHPSGLQTPCHQCWQCKENRVNDWVGRCIAEKTTSLACTVVTLTYGGGDCPESRFLRKSDVTDYLKAIRNKSKHNPGYKVRFFAVGEYGSKKGRAHWHVILFWQEPMPHREMRKNITDKWWPHGFSYWDTCDGSGIRYAMKYINKDFGDEDAIRNMGMSRKPILGRQYFAELAQRYVDQGLSPQKPFYRFPDILDKHDKPIHFYMPPLVAETFALDYIAAWRKSGRGKHWPSSEFIDKFDDKNSGYHPEIQSRPFRKGESPWMLPPEGCKMLFSEKLNTFYTVQDGETLYWSYDKEGQRAWQREIVTEAKAEALQSMSRAKRLAEYARQNPSGMSPNK